MTIYMYNICIYIYIYIYINNIKSYERDIIQFLTLTLKIDSKIFIVSFDISNLYNYIPHELGIIGYLILD